VDVWVDYARQNNFAPRVDYSRGHRSGIVGPQYLAYAPVPDYKCDPVFNALLEHYRPTLYQQVGLLLDVRSLGTLLLQVRDSTQCGIMDRSYGRKLVTA
jgi:hypothetical protein